MNESNHRIESNESAHTAKFGAFFMRHPRTATPCHAIASAPRNPCYAHPSRPHPPQSPAQAKQARSLNNLRHDARQFSTMKPLSFNTRRGSNRSRTPSIRACWKGILQLAIVGILSTYAVGMWLGLRYALYSSDYETDTGGDQPVNNIKAIAILGERNSGTRWLWTHLNECFNHSIPEKGSWCGISTGSKVLTTICQRSPKTPLC